MSLALPSARRSTNRGSAHEGEPSGIRMSQNIRAESPVRPSFQGRTWKVPGSGLAIMSLSEARAKPSIAEPSNPMPSAKAPSSSAGATATDFRKPSTSVNHSRTKRISRSSSVRSTNSCCLSTVTPLTPPVPVLLAQPQCPMASFHRRYPAWAPAQPAPSGRRRGFRRRYSGARRCLQGAAGDPPAPGHAPLVVARGERQGAAGVPDVDDVPVGEVVVEPLGVLRGEVDAAVRDVLLALCPDRPRRGVHELAVRGDPHRERDLLLVVLRVLLVGHPVGGGAHDLLRVLLGHDVRAALGQVVD